MFGNMTVEVLPLQHQPECQNNKYQIGLAYRTDCFPSANIRSFANDVHTTCGGSLVD
jgi:hypothetical protein